MAIPNGLCSNSGTKVRYPWFHGLAEITYPIHRSGFGSAAGICHEKVRVAAVRVARPISDVGKPRMDRQIELATAAWAASSVIGLYHRLCDTAEQPNLVESTTGTIASLRTKFTDDLLRRSGIGTSRVKRISLDGQCPVDGLSDGI